MPTKKSALWGMLSRNQILIPIAALVLLALFNLIADPSFFRIYLKDNANGDPVLSGNLISIIDSGSELAILALGMTLVTAASGGQDISVGAAIAISGSVLLRILCRVEFCYPFGRILRVLPDTLAGRREQYR